MIMQCGEKECVKYPHEMEENMYHVPCALCGKPRPYIETEDWQTQKEMMEMCSPCIIDLAEDNGYV